MISVTIRLKSCGIKYLNFHLGNKLDKKNDGRNECLKKEEWRKGRGKCSVWEDGNGKEWVLWDDMAGGSKEHDWSWEVPHHLTSPHLPPTARELSERAAFTPSNFPAPPVNFYFPSNSNILFKSFQSNPLIAQFYLVRKYIFFQILFIYFHQF